MASRFGQIFKRGAVGPLMRALADGNLIEYRDGESDPVELQAIVGDERTEDRERDEGGRERVCVRTVTISTDPSSPYGGVTSPIPYARLVIGGVGYAISSLENSDDGLVDLEVTRISPTGVSRRGY